MSVNILSAALCNIIAFNYSLQVFLIYIIGKLYVVFTVNYDIFEVSKINNKRGVTMTNTLEKLKEVVKTNEDFKQQLEDVWSSITEALEKIEDIKYNIDNPDNKDIEDISDFYDNHIEDIKDNLEIEQGNIQEAIDEAIIKFNLED